MDIKCRACLATTDAKMYHSLSTVFPEYMKTKLSVLDLLEVVTSTKVSIWNSFPNSICTACLKELKDSYKFIQKFKDAQTFLEENFSLQVENQQENIIVKVEEDSEQFSDSVILDSDENNIFKPEFEQEVIQEYKDKKTKNKKNTVKRPRQKSSVTVTRKREPAKRKHAVRHEQENDDIVVMSIEDVVKEEHEKAERKVNTTRKSDPLINVDEYIIRAPNPHKEERPIKPKNNIFVMSINDVLDSSADIKHGEACAVVRKKKTKGIITQSTDLIKNLERKTATRRARKLKTDEEAQMFTCDLCDKVYRNRRSLFSHKWSMHVEGWQEKFKCNICGKQCQTRSSFTHHKKKHEGKKISCEECGKVYLTTTQLKQHKKTSHGDGLQPKYLCNECGKTFKFKNGLQYHVVSAHHASDKPYMCRYCGFKCVQKSYLKRHERCHTDERPYVCQFCDKTFRGSAELQSHEMTHKGITRYNCKHCGKGFRQTWNLKVHSLQHVGGYVCHICTRGFIDETVLKFHFYHHHKIRDNVQKDNSDDDTNSNADAEEIDSESLYFEAAEDEDSIISDVLLHDDSQSFPVQIT